MLCRIVFHRGKCEERERTRTIQSMREVLDQLNGKLDQLTNEILDQVMPWNCEVKEQCG